MDTEEERNKLLEKIHSTLEAIFGAICVLIFTVMVFH